MARQVYFLDADTVAALLKACDGILDENAAMGVSDGDIKSAAADLRRQRDAGLTKAQHAAARAWLANRTPGRRQ